MSRRYFRCPNCEHRLRFNTAACSICGTGTPFMNRLSVILISVGLVLVLLFGIAGVMS
ncbi:hypothetical protein FIU97_00370 [Roseivivax sp. THAF40]|nr:hypothetical protein FIV09_00455 [Roseivivax sp. THAF197b]QFT45020.1 hypothetical protein FIU97_00370 [Roseivivax sp. THAF40]